ncbi:DUF6157 family protein [Acidocella sp.]|uniref:DUF6157 family protein n=1 Tax=Acidocella sp. TaxID=50710 RepID=UPI00260C639D|nr:DUF6157 family protein [Acidocella sp.]
MAMGYLDTFAEVVADRSIRAGVMPDRSMSTEGIEQVLLTAGPDWFTGEDLILAVHARHKGVGDADIVAFKAALFSRPQMCLRASPLPKR